MTKTARHWCSSITRSYADMFILPRNKFEQIIQVIFYSDFKILFILYLKILFKLIKQDFPKEGEKFRKIAIDRIKNLRVFENPKIFSLVAFHSSKSIGKNYETIYTRQNIWIKPLY